MAVNGKKISEMEELVEVKGTEYIPVVDGTSNKKVKTSSLMNEERISAIEDVVFPYSIQVSGGGTFEKGVSRSITVTWTVKKGNDVITPDSVTVNGEIVSGNSKVFSNVSSTVKYTVVATVGSKQLTGSTTATFVSPMYFGFAADSTSSSLNITSLVKQPIKTSPSGTYSLVNSTTGHYMWLCVPISMTINKVTSSGFDIPMESYQSGSTSVDTYKCYRSSSQINQGTVNIVIS